MAELDRFKIEMENQRLKNELRNKRKIEETKKLLDKFGTFSKPEFIEGKDLFSFANRNIYIIGEMIFEVINKETNERFLAYYYQTENSFVSIFDDDIWYFDNSVEYDNRIDNFKAIPIFINYK